MATLSTPRLVDEPRTAVPDPAVPDTPANAPATAAAQSSPRGRLLRAEIAARLAMPIEGGVSVAMAGILQQVARQIAARGAPLG